MNGLKKNIITNYMFSVPNKCLLVCPERQTDGQGQINLNAIHLRNIRAANSKGYGQSLVGCEDGARSKVSTGLVANTYSTSF